MGDHRIIKMGDYHIIRSWGYKRPGKTWVDPVGTEMRKYIMNRKIEIDKFIQLPMVPLIEWKTPSGSRGLGTSYERWWNNEKKGWPTYKLERTFCST